MNVQEYHIKSEDRLFKCAESIPNGYKCNICNFKCDLKIDLFDHSVQVHDLAEIKHGLTDIIKFNCQNCKFQTYSFLVFYKHHCKPWELKIQNKAGDCNVDPFTCASILELYKCKNCDFCTNLKILFKTHENHAHNNQALYDSFTALDLQKTFTCSICKLQTCSVLVLYKHVCTPVAEQQIMWRQCEFCNFKTKWRPSLLRHSKIMHPSGKCYKCKHCGHIFAQVMDLENHLLRMHCAENEKPFHCEHCEYKSKQEPHLKRHLRLKHGIATWFKCEHCKTTFVRKLHLKKHLEQKHTVKNVKWYKCDFCEHTTKYAGHMKRHLLCQHANGDKIALHQCAQCEYKTEVTSSLIRHFELVHLSKNNFKWFNCVYCEHTFILRSELKKHLTEQHSVVAQTAKPFHCEHCDYKTQFSYRLKIHMLRKHTDHQDINWLKCEHCQETFLLKQDLDTHLLKAHSNKDEKWSHCDKCVYKTPYPWILKDHILRKHTDDQKIDWFQCEHCEFKTKMKRSLKLHVLRRHTPIEDIQLVKCNLCPYVGKQRGYLKIHMRTKHKGEAQII